MQPDSRCSFKASTPMLMKPVPHFTAVSWFPYLPRVLWWFLFTHEEWKETLEVHFLSKLYVFCQPRVWDKDGKRGIQGCLKCECCENLCLTSSSAFERYCRDKDFGFHFDFHSVSSLLISTRNIFHIFLLALNSYETQCKTEVSVRPWILASFIKHVWSGSGLIWSMK